MRVGRKQGSVNLKGGRQDRPRVVTDDEVLAYGRATGRRIRDLRLELGMSPQTLSQACGVNQATLHRIEAGYYDRQGREKAGRYGVTLYTLVRIARGMDVRPSDLLP